MAVKSNRSQRKGRKMKKTIGLIILMACLMITKPASATLLTLGGGWDAFSFGGSNSSFSDTWQFTVEDSSLLTVTDAYLSGDRFEIFNFGASMGLTSDPATFGDFTDNFDIASADPRWSTGFFILGAGTYDISGIATLAPYQEGGAAIKLDRYYEEEPPPVVPEPASMFLLGSGLLGLAGIRRKRK